MKPNGGNDLHDRFKDEVAIVTGAGSGIGKEIAFAFAGELRLHFRSPQFHRFAHMVALKYWSVTPVFRSSTPIESLPFARHPSRRCVLATKTDGLT